MAQKKRKILKRVDKTVDLIFVGFLLIILLYSGYSWWDTNNMYTLASAANYAMFRPNPVYIEEEGLGFEELQRINPNVFGWIHIFGTNIDYPLLQTTDNQRYVYHSARGEASRAGAIFLDFRNNQDFTDFNNIIYGHDMDRGAMFGDIAGFEAEHIFETHRFGVLFTGEKFYGIELFSFILADANNQALYNPNIVLDEAKEAFFELLYEESIQFRDLGLTVDDRLVMLSTCTPNMTNGRHILMGRLMEEIPEDLFDGSGGGRGIDRLLAGIGELGLAVGSLLIVILTAGITFFIANARKRKKLLAEGAALVKAEKRRKLSIMEEALFTFGKVVMIGAMLFMFFRFAFGFVQVTDASMIPSMREGDLVLYQRIGASHVLAADVIVVNQGGQAQVRRTIAVAGDVVDITERGLEINGRIQNELHIFELTEQFSEGIEFPLTVPYGEIFVMGDSRARSRDSRIYGTVHLDDVLGSVVTVLRGREL